MSIPFYYKPLGHIHKNTLDNYLMNNYTIILNEFPGNSLDMFSYTSCRTTTYNSFDQKLDWPVPRKNSSQNQYHMPVLKNLEDPRNLLHSLRNNTFQVTLIDPPFTSYQQYRLYGQRVHDLLTGNPSDIETLYQVSCEYAFKHTTHAVVTYGFKFPPPPSEWKVVACWAIGGGPHPTIMAFLYIRHTVLHTSVHLIKRLKDHAKLINATISRIKHISAPVVSPPRYCLDHLKVRVPNEWTIIRKSDEYKRLKMAHEPTLHSTYLSLAMIDLARMRPVTIHTNMVDLYRRSKKYKAECFILGVYNRRLYTTKPYGDITFVLTAD
jgi:hypothetical protein